MPDVQTLALVFMVGVLLGVAFFASLWWTVRRGLASAQPALWFLGGFMLRMTVTVYGFYLAGGSDWRRWLACVAGFMVARLVVDRLTRANPAAIAEGAGHASQP
jgi:F1F0 ATPase subunit 2